MPARVSDQICRLQTRRGVASSGALRAKRAPAFADDDQRRVVVGKPAQDARNRHPSDPVVLGQLCDRWERLTRFLLTEVREFIDYR